MRAYIGITMELLNERASTHGSFDNGAEVEQTLKEALRNGDNWSRLPTPHKAALEMVCHKMSRHVTGDFLCTDHITDAIGYLRLLLAHTQKLNGAYEITTSRKMLARRSDENE
jgi:hypothetical protein